jgi:hypothetical protein
MKPKSKLEDISTFFRRTSFHDAKISRLSCRGGRAIIETEDYALIFVGVSAMKHCPLPAYWLQNELSNSENFFTLHIKTHTGEAKIVFTDFRAIEKAEFRIVVPNLDGETTKGKTEFY